MRFLRFAPLLFAAALAPAAETLPADLLPPGTRVLIGVSLRSLIDSALAHSLAGDTGKLTAAMAAAPKFAGIDLVKDLDSVIFASSGEGENAPGLLILRGRFHPDRLTGARDYKGVPILEDKRAGKGAVALLDSAAAIAGTLAEVRAAIDRRGRGPVASPAIGDRFASLAERYDFWGVGDLPEGFHSSNPSAKNLDSVDHFEFGAALGEGLQVDAEIHVRSAEDAAQMTMALTMFQAMMKSQLPSPGGTKFDLRSENGTLKLAVFIPEAELRKGIAAQKDVLSGMLKAQLGAGVGAPAVSAPSAVDSRSAVEPRRQLSRPPSAPARIVTNDRGETVSVTLPGGR